jgi:predicted 3-demethylubiquinone-9 3-methyltransferase (glyoxalase superfamily)
MLIQKITPFLWFDNRAEEAVQLYTSVFKNSRVLKTSYYGDNAPMPKGTVMVVSFQLEEQTFNAINGGPAFQFSPAISFVVNCETQEEIDFLWEKLTEGGQAQSCGWLKDKFGISWQIVPVQLGDLMSSKDSEKSNRAMQALWKMGKLNIAELQKAFDGE